MANLLQQTSEQDESLNKRSIKLRNPKTLQSYGVQEVLGGQQIQQTQSQQVLLRRPKSRTNQNQTQESTKETNSIEDSLNYLQQNFAPVEIQPNSMPQNQEQYRRFSAKNTQQQQIQENQIKTMNMNEHAEIEDKQRQGQQDRMIQFLMDQFGSLEKQFQAEIKRNRMQIDSERDIRSRLEQEMRFMKESISTQSNEFGSKIEFFENKLQREEKIKADLQQKLIVNEQNQKEILFFIRNMQKAESSELLQMRGILQDKITEETQNTTREKEKSKALFLEMVRLGEQHEKQQELVSSLQTQLESRLAAIEGKVSSGERAVVSMAQKGDSGLNYINDWNDKLEKRVQMLEGNLLQIGKEQLKDRDSLGKIENVNNRLSEDVKTLLVNLQKDYQQRLDSRVTEIVNRIIMEHEERIRSNDDLRNNIDVRDKINQEKSNYEKEEMRERYMALDSLVRAEFQRKDEAIKSLQAILENQIRAMQNGLKMEEQSRNQQEAIFKSEILKIQENLAREYDLFKGQQSNITEKITEMMKIEIQTRLSSDVDLKNLTSAIATDLIAEFNTMKDQLEASNKKLSQEIKDCSLESAQRSQQLSRYIDEENKKIIDILGKKYEKMKTIFTKLAEQFKNHLINTENNRKDVEKRLLNLERGVEDLRAETYKIVGETQKAFDNRLKEEKRNLQIYVDTKTTTLSDKISKLEEELNKDVDLLKKALEQNRLLLTEKINNLVKQNENYHKQHEENIQKVLDMSKQLKEFIQKLNSDLEQLSKELVNTVADLERRLTDQLQELRQTTQEQIQLLNNQEQELKQQQIKDVSEIAIKMKEIIDDNEQFQTEAAKQLKELQQQENQNLGLMVQSTQNLENLQKFVEDKMLIIQSHRSVDLSNQSNENVSLKQIISQITQTQLEQNQIEQINQNQNQKDFEALRKNVEEIQKKVFEDLSETYDRKIQNIMERLRQEMQEMWEENIKNVQSDYKDANLQGKQNDQIFSLLNEIIITQDTYNKPIIKE